MKKIITTILIITIIFTFIMPKYIYAASVEQYNNLAGEGKASVNGNKTTVIDTPSSGDVIASILAIASSSIAAVVKGLLSACVNEDDITQETNFTIGELVSGDYKILNNDFLLEENDSPSNSSIKKQVAGWYYALRNLSVVISLLVLIYIGIRMAISTLSDDKVKYKKMLIGWVQGFILLFLLHYIMFIAMYLQKALINILPHVDGQAERTIASTCWKEIIMATGWDILWFAILYWVLTYYQVKFFFLYAKRMISTAFLMVISPFITITYPIDKIKDNKAQAFYTWLKEFLVNVFIQPVHLIIYFIFIISASEIATVVPLFTIIFFGALSRGEKIIKGIMGMRGMKSINSIGRKKKK